MFKEKSLHGSKIRSFTPKYAIIEVKSSTSVSKHHWLILLVRNSAWIRWSTCMPCLSTVKMHSCFRNNSGYKLLWWAFFFLVQMTQKYNFILKRPFFLPLMAICQSILKEDSMCRTGKYVDITFVPHILSVAELLTEKKCMGRGPTLHIKLWLPMSTPHVRWPVPVSSYSLLTWQEKAAAEGRSV